MGTYRIWLSIVSTGLSYSAVTCHLRILTFSPTNQAVRSSPGPMPSLAASEEGTRTPSEAVSACVPLNSTPWMSPPVCRMPVA